MQQISHNHLFPPHKWALRLSTGCDPSPCNQFSALPMLWHVALDYFATQKFSTTQAPTPFPVPVPARTANQFILLGVQLLMPNAPLHTMMPCLPDLALKPQTGWTPCESTLYLTQAPKSGSGKPFYEDVFLMLFVLTCHDRPHPSGLLELQRFWYLVQICHSVRTLPSPSLALMPMWLPSLCSTVSDTLRHTWMHGWPLYPTWALAFWSADDGPSTQWLLDWNA